MTFEHVVALHMLDAPDDFFFVQIGAFDGRSGDPIRAFVERYRWRGLLVEPQERYFSQLLSSYQGHPDLIFKKVAVSRHRENRLLYRLETDAAGLPEWAPQLASFDRATLLSHREEIPDIERLIQAEEVDCLPLSDLLSELSIARIDLLCVDVEGYDHEIIQMLDFQRFRPCIIRFEHAHLTVADHNATVELLIAEGYLVAIERFDTVAYRASTA